MESLEALLIEKGAHLVECWGWPAAGGEYHTYGRHGIILLDVSLPLKKKRWILAHEVSHHLTPVFLYGDRKLAERKADILAVHILAERYRFEDVDWPPRVLKLEIMKFYFPKEMGCVGECFEGRWAA